MAGQSRTNSLDHMPIFLMLATAAVHAAFSSNIVKGGTAATAEETTMDSTSPAVDVQEEFRSIGNYSHRVPVGGMNGENRLYVHLMEEQKLKRASLSMRPVGNSSEAVNVTFFIKLQMIPEFDGTKQTLTTKVLMFTSWDDPLLVWNPDDYDGLEEIKLPQNVIWKPDIELFNNADEKKTGETFLIVRNWGSVLSFPAVLLKSSCNVDIRNFPYDEQTCGMRFVSWAYDAAQLNLSLLGDGAYLDDYMPNPEWDLLNFTAKKVVNEYNIGSYIQLEFSLHLVRRSGIYSLVLVMPTLMLTFLTIAVFLAPLRRKDRTANAMGLFSSFFIVLLILVQSCPPSAASLSLLGIYHCLNMAIVAVWLVIVSALEEVMEGKHKRPVPTALRMVFLKVIAKLICVRSVTHTPKNFKIPSDTIKPALQSSTAAIEDVVNEIDPAIVSTSTAVAVPRTETSPKDVEQMGYTKITAPVAKETGLRGRVTQRLSTFSTTIGRDDGSMQLGVGEDTKTGEVEMEWKLLAKTIDRFIAIVFSLCICVALVVVFPRPIH